MCVINVQVATLVLRLKQIYRSAQQRACIHRIKYRFAIPQPFESVTTIESTTVEIKSITIVDATGNVVYQKTGLNVMKIEVGETLTNGMYTAIIQTESGTTIIKILKLK